MTKSGAKKGFQILKFPIEAMIAVVFGCLGLFGGIVFLIRPPEDVPSQVADLAPFAAFLIGALLIASGIYFLLRPPVVIGFSGKGLWIQKHKVTIPWNMIDQVDIFSPTDRQSSKEKVASHAVNVAFTGRKAPRHSFIVLSLTNRGKKKFANKKFLNQFMRSSLKMKSNEDIIISPAGMMLSKTPLKPKNVQGVIAAIRRKSQKAS